MPKAPKGKALPRYPWAVPRIWLPSITHAEQATYANASKVNVSRHSFVLNGKGRRVGLIAKSPDKDGLFTTWVYYPRPAHSGLFYENTDNLKPGPAFNFAGSVGSALVFRHNGTYLIDYLQSHFKTNPKGPVTRSLADKYGGWRGRILGEIFKEAEAEKFREVGFNLKPEKIHGESARIFSQVAKNHGFSVSVSAKGLLAVKK